MKRPIKSISYLFAIFGCFFHVNSYSQSDTSFWFSAPEVCLGNFSPWLDQPIRLVLSTYSSPATVNISQPANPGFPAINISIPANSYQEVDLTPWLTMIECTPANTVLNYGFHITATSKITVYYEVVSPGNNPEIFTLKGNNAMGLDFMIPTQNLFENNPGYLTDSPRNSFDITATENGTSVTIIPSQAIVGHAAGIPFVINLNKGQVYSATASTHTPAGHLCGSRVTSNKPVVITEKDDLIRPLGLPCSDLMGDQIVPINKLGTEHIVVRGYLNYPPTINNEDFFFVMATQNNTVINVNGAYVTTINAGSTYNSPFTGVSAYIQTDKPVSVIHVSGTGCEMAQALVPPIPCTGSTEVSFTRTSAQNFGLILLAPAGSEGSFSINTPLVITPAAFTAVPGTGGQWMAADINCNTTQIPVGQNIRVTNSGDLFHLGIINFGSAPGGCRYGYFSDYNTINLVQQDSFSMCPNDSILITASSIMDTYNWSTGDTTSSIYVNTAGVYILTSTNNFCSATDTIFVIVENDSLYLGADTVLCSNNSLTLNAPGFSSYLWSTGSNASTITVIDSGYYHLTVVNSNGCELNDSIQIGYYNSQVLNIGNDTNMCNSSASLVVGSNGFANYLWNTGATTPLINVDSTGLYVLEVIDSNFCTLSDTVEIVYQVVNIELGNDTTLCNGNNILLSAPSGYTIYNWNSGATTSSITTTGPGIYSVTVENNTGCNDSDSINLTWISPPVFSLGNDTILCPGYTLDFDVTNIGATYQWQDNSIAPTFTVTQEGTYWVNVNLNGCELVDSAIIDYLTIPIIQLGNDTVLCEGEAYLLDASVEGAVYQWQNNSNSPIFNVYDQGQYWVAATNICGTSTDTINIGYKGCICDLFIPNSFTPNDDELNQLFNPETVCEFSSYSFSIFDRWGRQIFLTNDPLASWDGTINGNLIQVGVYVYRLEYQFNIPHSLPEVRIGHVNLLR